jgi:hypothetical protein
MGGHKLITINGEVTSKENIDIEKIVKNIVGEDYKVIINIVKQSPEICSECRYRRSRRPRHNVWLRNQRD